MGGRFVVMEKVDAYRVAIRCIDGLGVWAKQRGNDTSQRVYHRLQCAHESHSKFCTPSHRIESAACLRSRNGRGHTH